MARPRKDSTDVNERIEWQLDQIRTNTLVVALFAALALIGSVLSVLTSLS